jgi:hypothetical protein
LPGSLGALPPPWVAQISPDESAVAVLDGAGRVTLVDTATLAVRWQVPVVRGDTPVSGQIVFGPTGLAVAAGPRDGAPRVVVLDVPSGRLEPLGRAPDGAQVVALSWTPEGTVRTRTREKEAGNPIDVLFDRTWGPKPTERELGAFTPGRRVQPPGQNRAFVDETSRRLDRSGNVAIQVDYRVWDDAWDPRSARSLRDCPEWSQAVHVSEDGRVAYTMGQVRCVYDLDAATVVAWESKQVPFWSTLSPDGALVVERHGKGGRRWGVARKTASGEVLLEIDNMEGAVFTAANSVVAWTPYRLELVRLGDGSRAWSLPVDGEVLEVRVSPNARSIVVLERVVAGARPRLRVLDADGAVRGVVDDIDGILSFSPGSTKLLVKVRSDALAVVDLAKPGVSGPPKHKAALRALAVDDVGHVVSGDDEGRVRVALGTPPVAWEVPGEVVDVVRSGEEIVTLSAQRPQQPGETTRWWVERRVPGDTGRRPVAVSEQAMGARLLPDAAGVVLFEAEGPFLAPAGRGRATALPVWGEKGDPGPEVGSFVPIPGKDRILGVPMSSTTDRASAWSFTRRQPVGSYALGLGRPAVLAASARHVVVLDARGGGRVFSLEGGGASDLAVVDAAIDPCCAAVGGGIVAVATGRGAVHVHDATSGDLVQVIQPGFAARLSAVSVSPNGDFVAVGSEGGEIATWKR